MTETTKKKVRIGRTTNRTLGFTTPTVSDEKCPYFYDRFIRHGVALPEARAVCELENTSLLCDYRKLVNGIPMCMRYWYGPKYELTDLIRTPYIQKKNDKGALLFYEIDGVTETTQATTRKVMIPVHEAHQFTYNGPAQHDEQITYFFGGVMKPAFWSFEQYEPEIVDYDTGFPVMKYGNMQFYSTQYEDTHEKRFFANGGQLGWHKDV